MNKYQLNKELSERNYIKREIIFRVFPLSEYGASMFTIRKPEMEMFVCIDDFGEERHKNINNLYNFARNNNDVLGDLEYKKDYDMEIVKIINHEYQNGLDWDDIKVV